MSNGFSLLGELRRISATEVIEIHVNVSSNPFDINISK